jgi:hypothetical protein
MSGTVDAVVYRDSLVSALGCAQVLGTMVNDAVVVNVKTSADATRWHSDLRCEGTIPALHVVSVRRRLAPRAALFRASRYAAARQRVRK